MLRWKCCVLLVAVMLLLTACSFTNSDPEAFMRPPKLYGEQKGIQEALESKVGKNFILKSPKTGNYRSAFVMSDFDQDGKDEVITFYSKLSESAVVHFMILDKVGDQWETTYSAVGNGTDINSVTFEDLDGSGKKEIIISWDSATSSTEKEISIYKYNAQDALENIYEDIYTEMVMRDMTGNGTMNLLLFNLNTSERTSKVRMLALQDGKIKEVGAADMDGNVTQYAALSTKSDEMPPTVYVDSYKGDSKMITEIIHWSNNRLLNVFYNATDKSTNLTERNVLLTCRDIDEDGQLEIPGEYPMVGADKEERALKLTKWSQHVEGQLKPVSYSVVNRPEGYIFVYPLEWLDTVTVVSDAKTRTWSFYIWDESTQEIGQELLSIRAYKESEVGGQLADGYSQWKRVNGTVYGVRLGAAANLYAIGIDTLEQNFKSLS